MDRFEAAVAELPDDHDWEDSGQYRGEVLVDIWTCRRCGVGWQRTHPEPDTPEGLIGWSAWLEPDGDTWDEDSYLPDCLGEE